ncbi:MAG: hypothetical protein HZT40_08955 [Candidatus Thiothrix singaporensis]|uniref:Uncharacterized protein n=1 Tax=Candidatus Thiothrix singaporensis TaxID=2799669 RepID=A0A7L6ARI7_9GAMM|nr:MAG: hypothetical protein HZT40_08955 [Candidatus Thiothrix singaporensis]
MDIAISDIVTNYPAGMSNVYIRYENIPGYWDGQMVCQIQKSPLVMSGGRVGVWTEASRERLEVDGNIRLHGWGKGCNYCMSTTRKG